VDAARVLKLREAAWDWCATDGADLVQRVYLDLTFAYALARSGDGPAAQALLDDVGRPDAPGGRRGKHRPHPSSLEPHQRWLWDAYRDRVRRLLDGEPPTAPLSADLRRRLGELDPPAGGEQRQRAERFLKVSRVLDPFSRVDPFRHTRPQDPLGEALADLAAYTAPRRKRDDGAEQIELGFRALFKEHPQPRDTLRILATAVPLSVRVGETFALDCVARVGPALERVGRWRDARDLIDRAELLEAAVGVAAHFGRQALIEGLLGGLHALLKDARGEVAGWVAAALGGGSFRFLSRLGLVDAARTLLDRMTDALTAGKSVGKYLGAPGLNRGVVYPALLRLAGGWFYFGQEEPARRALEAARAELFDGSMSPDPRADLAAAYAAALGHAPARAALDGFAELFARLRVTSYNAVLHRVKIVEAIALATGAEDFAADPRAKRWLDEDEYLVRRRIHADVARALAGAALR
jgi:hypothetical protein